MPVKPNSIEARDIASLIHPYTNLVTFPEVGPLVLDKGKGIHVYDPDGKEYIEGMAGLWCTSLGFDEEELIDAAVAQLHKLPYTHLFSARSHPPAIELAEKLKAIAPLREPASKVFYTCSGSEANDTQIKLMRYYNNVVGRPKKKKIISRIKAYHGITLASASLTGLPPMHADFDLPLPGFLHTDCPHHYRFAEDGETEEEFATRLADNLDQLIQKEDPETVAAFIAEPVLGAGGVIVPPRGYYKKIEAVLAKYDILVIDDEVICGFGRTGNMFGAETMDMSPHTMSVAKALSSAYVPIGAVVVPEFMYEALQEGSRRNGTFGMGFTYGGHPLGCAVAVKTLELYEKRDTVGHVRSVAPRFQSRLKALGDHPLVGEARGVGLVGGVELVADKRTKRPFKPGQTVGAIVQGAAQARGLIVRAIGDTVAVCPPLIIEEGQIDDLFDRLARALDDADNRINKEGLRAA